MMNAEPADAGHDAADLLRRYYAALETGAALAPFYATDEAAGELGPVVKIGSGSGEVFTGFGAISAEVERVGAHFARNRLESRALIVHRAGNVAWMSDLVWWSGEVDGQPFASLTRWTGVCRRFDDGWRFLQLHVSEGV
jgi:hypothetical protein